MKTCENTFRVFYIIDFERNCMIKSIMVFKKNGPCMFYKNINYQFNDPHQMSGFFSAINFFCINTFNENIQHISTINSMIHFRHQNDNIFAIITDKKEYFKGVIDDLIDNFLLEFTSKKDKAFLNEGKIPEFPYFNMYLGRFEKIEVV